MLNLRYHGCVRLQKYLTIEKDFQPAQKYSHAVLQNPNYMLLNVDNSAYWSKSD